MISASPESSPRSFATSVAAQNSPQAQTAWPVCPECKGGLIPVPHRFIDRVISIIHPVRRYDCRSFLCNWQGNLAGESSKTDRWHASATYTQGRAQWFSAMAKAKGDRLAPTDARAKVIRSLRNQRWGHRMQAQVRVKIRQFRAARERARGRPRADVRRGPARPRLLR